MGCDKVPTFQELTSGKPQAEAKPEAIVSDEPPPPPPRPEVQGPPPRTPRQILDEFLATESRLRHDARLAEVAALDDALRREITSLDVNSAVVTDVGARHLSKFPALQELNVSRTSITNQGMAALSGLSTVRRLRLNGLFIDGEGLKEIAGLSSLTELGIAGTSISDGSFEHLVKMDSLEVLDISGNSKLLGQGFAELVRRNVLKNLKELHASGTSLGYYGFRDLKGLPGLEVLTLANANIAEEALDNIVVCRNLRVLNLQGNPIGNDGLKKIARLKQLEALLVGGCVGVTDQGLASLRGLSNLRRLDLNNTRCSPAAVQQLKEKSLPNATIVFQDREI
jgi:Leucine-rich repeat (LRR) protein